MGHSYQNIDIRSKMIYSLAIFLFGSLCLGAPSEEFPSPISSDPLMRQMDAELEDSMGGSDYFEGLEDYNVDFEGSEMDYDGDNRQIDEEPEVEIDDAEYGDYAEDALFEDGDFEYDDEEEYEDLDEYGEEYEYEYEHEEYEDMDRIVPKDRSDVNNCQGKANGDKCTKTCRGPSCKNAKCWEQTCLTGRKYKIVAGAGRMQSKTPGGDYNNCAGKKDGESCKKRCHSKACQEGKCFKTVCLTSRKYRIAGGSK